MSGRMPTQRIVAYTVATGRALVQCGETAAWMEADDAYLIRDAWMYLADDIYRRRKAVESAMRAERRNVIIELVDEAESVPLHMGDVDL